MSLSNWQFAFNSYTVGAGTAHSVQAVDGLESLPSLRTADSSRGYIDGDLSGKDFYAGRTITIDIVTKGDGSHSALYYYKLLQAAWAPQLMGDAASLTLFQFRLGDANTYRAYGRVRGNETALDMAFGAGAPIRSRFTLYFPDPRYYGDTLQSAGPANSLTIVNNGWANTCPVVTISSPPSSFSLSSLYGTMNFGNVPAHDVVVDLQNRTILCNLSPARNILLGSSQWIYFPGGTATLVYTGTGSNKISATWRDAYL